jgi:hypothetical protein
MGILQVLLASTQNQMTTLQSCFGEGEGLSFLHILHFVTKDPPQQLPARVLWDHINELDPASQPLVRSLAISDMLNSNNLITAQRQNG